MIILGIDPGQESCGFALVEYGVPVCRGTGRKEAVLDSGVVWHFCFTPFIASFFAQRLFDLAACEGIKSYRASYDNGAAWTRNIIASLAKTSNIIGQLKMACHIHSIPFVTYARDEVNQFIHGSNRCSKRELQEAVRLRLGLDKPIRPAHCNDAVALALYAGDQWRSNKLCKKGAGEAREFLRP